MNPFDTRSVTFAEPIEMLYACHDKVRRFCHQIALLPPYLANHGCNEIALQTMRQIQHYFTVAAPLHHQDEEQDFFPLLVQYAPQAQTTIHTLLSQHETLHQHWQAVANDFAHICQHANFPIQATVLQEFISAYQAHLAIEEPLFELGKQHIPAAKLHTIGNHMAQRRRS